jgi:hypothetical protein
MDLQTLNLNYQVCLNASHGGFRALWLRYTYEATYRHEHMRMTADERPYMSKLALFVEPFVVVLSLRVTKTNVSLFIPELKVLGGFLWDGQACTNSGPQVVVATAFCTGAPDVCGSSVWNQLHDTLLAPIILTLLLNFGKCLHPGSNNVGLHRESEKDEFWR